MINSNLHFNSTFLKLGSTQNLKNLDFEKIVFNEIPLREPKEERKKNLDVNDLLLKGLLEEEKFSLRKIRASNKIKMLNMRQDKSIVRVKNKKEKWLINVNKFKK